MQNKKKMAAILLASFTIMFSAIANGEQKK